jgi:transposase
MRRTGGHVHDGRQAQGVIQDIAPAARLADTGYASDGVSAHRDVRRSTPGMPPRAHRQTPRECDVARSCERNRVARFFTIITHVRASAPRDEQTASNVLAGVHLVCARAWLN